MSQQAVEVYLPEYRAKGCLGKLRGLVDVVRNLNDSLCRIDDPQGNDGVHLQGDVIAGDDILRRHFHGFLPQADADDLSDGTEDPNDAGSFGRLLADAAKGKDHAPLILLENLDGIEQVEKNNGNGEEGGNRHDGPKTSGTRLRPPLRL